MTLFAATVTTPQGLRRYSFGTLISAYERLMIQNTKMHAMQSIASGAPIPHEFLCPISLEVMREPVKTEHGHTFDRAWIQRIIDSGENCPLTRKPFVTRKLVGNKELERAIAQHPEAAEEARTAAGPPPKSYSRASGLGAGVDTRDFSTGGRALRSQALRIDEPVPLMFNPAGRAHRCFSRNNLRLKIEAAIDQLQALESAGAPVETRARVAGRIRELQMYLRFAHVASPMTLAFDSVLGTYTRNSWADDRQLYRRLGVVGVAGALIADASALAGCGSLPLAQCASLIGASVKATVRLAAKGPALAARAMAQREYERSA